MKLYDRVLDTSTTTGTGSLTLTGDAPTGYRPFSAVPNGKHHYSIAHRNGTEWELGIGTLSGGNTLARTVVFSSSNSNNPVSFSSGIKDVSIDVSARSHFDQVDHLELPRPNTLLDRDIGHLVFGAGEDGKYTLDRPTPLILETSKHYDYLTIFDGTLYADGWRVSVRNTLHIKADGILSAKGFAGIDATSSTGAVAPAQPDTGEYFLTGNALGYSRGTAGTNAGAGVATTPVGVTHGDGNSPTYRYRPSILKWMSGMLGGGGNGGQGGQGGATGGGGSGGNGGGRLVVIANTIINDGIITAEGGLGGQGHADGNDGGNGGGGFVYILCRRFFGSVPLVGSGNYIIYELDSDNYRLNN